MGSPRKCLPAADVVWFPIEELPTRSLPSSGSKEERAPRSESGVPWRFLTDEPGGTHERHHRYRPPHGDPTRRSRHWLRRGRAGHRHGSATKQQTDRLVEWAKPFKKRTWAFESAGGLGYLLAQQLVDAGEHVLDVPATWPRGCGSWGQESRTRTIQTTPGRWPFTCRVNPCSGVVFERNG